MKKSKWFSTMLNKLSVRLQNCDHEGSVIYVGVIAGEEDGDANQMIGYCRSCKRIVHIDDNDAVYQLMSYVSYDSKQNRFLFGVHEIDKDKTFSKEWASVSMLASQGKLMVGLTNIQHLINAALTALSLKNNQLNDCSKVINKLEEENKQLTKLLHVPEQLGTTAPNSISAFEMQFIKIHDCITKLLNENKCIVEADIKKVFLYSITSFYGYEKARMKWMWNDNANGDMIIEKRTKSRKSKK